MNFLDLFTGKSSGNQGVPTTSTPGEGQNGDEVLKYLGVITGAYQTITGQGNPGGPAPGSSVQTAPKTQDKTWIYIAGAAGLGLILWLVLRK